jgi:hypothetical protein
MSLLAGDAMHNTRTALDHLACACVRASGKEPTDQTAFPINERRPTGRFLEVFKAKVARMKRGYVEGITRLQPYENPATDESRKLLRLGVLDNLDKHKLLIPTATVANPDPVRPLKTYGASAEPPKVIYNVGAALAPGVEFCRQRLPRRRTGQVLYGDVPFLIELRFGGPDIGIAQLREIHSHVVGIVESFGPGFDR